MGQEYLIDSNILIGYLDNKLPERGMLFMHTVFNDIPRISVITKIEILRFNAPEKAYKVLQEFIKSSLVYSLDNITVDKTIALCKLKKIKLPDAIIAATALINKQILLTRNTSDFKNIPGLEVINPFEFA
ncbi:type II toxin-antitoxin system VapC family toxin (plasmid) [Pedobacter sp. BS3]|uniref:type II toxin-antitoxin system VapC family toxin n=1 Tax=Pedobacter sp. BS3 TaxID=2567937 RepID=UPI0011EDA351|nr:type II toxin-antitoxin system VapC family toxin [Pedobacter sp. BS3]TZF86192.1 type II toxin-antitoxin system VapC family toxin [Pedobacter sp. BS3]